MTDQWIIRIGWRNSSDTFVGPFDDLDAAERYTRTLDAEPAVTRYDLAALASVRHVTQKESPEPKCPCGLSAAHVDLPEDGPGWACRVPER
jgi:hypothetical protein